MSVTWMWVGALADTSVRVRAQVTGTSARLAVSTSPSLSSPTFTDTAIPGSTGMVLFVASGLTPNTQYYCAVEDTGVLDTITTGQFKTAPTVGQQASFSFGASSCANGSNTPTGAGGVSNDSVFDTIRLLEPLFFCHLGDFHYKNITENDVTVYRAAYDDVFAATRQHQLYRTVPTVYTWDDHDFASNNSDRTDPGRPAAAQAYRERVPSYPLPDSGSIGCWQSFTIGRVLFIASDCRSYRDPNANPDGPAHTMLGTEQKTWMRQVLESSTAEALVWLNPIPWMGTANDSWEGFSVERDELVDMFTETGWVDRMVTLNGDYHGLAMDSGGGNEYGGFPVAVFGSIDSLVDSNPGSPTSQYDQGPTEPGSHQYGIVDVADTGDTITITLSGYKTNDLRFRVTLEVAVESDEPGPEEPPPGPAPVAVAEITSRVTWLGCNLVTGAVIAELPDITGTVSRILGAYTSANLSMPIPIGGPAAIDRQLWEAATQPGLTMVVAVVNEVPTWGGIVLTRQAGTDAILQLGCVSLEGYLDRRFVGDHTWTQVDEVSVIVAGLVGDAQTQGIGLVLDTPSTGTLRDRAYKHTDESTVYARLRELSGVIDGPEWTIDLDWTDSSKTAVAKIFRARKRIGTEAEQPSVVFQITASSVFASRGASETRYVYVEDYTDNRGANHVIAASSGEGDDRPESAPATDVPAGWPRWERRINLSNNIDDVSTLNSHADAELALRRDGSNTWRISTRWDAEPRLNVDWALGDDVAWDLYGHRHPDGVIGQGRVIGWELNMSAGTVEPILWDPDQGV